MKKSILFLALLLKIPGVFASDHLTMEQQDEEMRHVLNKIPTKKILKRFLSRCEIILNYFFNV